MQLNPTTLVFEVINFLVLVWILSKLLYAPLRRAIEDRRHSLELARKDIDDTLETAKRLEQEWKTKNAGLIELGERVRAEALEDAVAEKGRMLAQAREDADAERAKVERLLEAERRDAEDWVRSTAIEESTRLAGRLLLSLAPDALDRVLVRALIDELSRQAEAAGEQAVEVEITGARMPAEEVVEELRAALAEAIGSAPRLTLREDPELLAGVVVRIGDHVLDASVAGQLAAFRQRARKLAEEAAHG